MSITRLLQRSTWRGECRELKSLSARSVQTPVPQRLALLALASLTVAGATAVANSAWSVSDLRQRLVALCRLGPDAA